MTGQGHTNSGEQSWDPRCCVQGSPSYPLQTQPPVKSLAEVKDIYSGKSHSWSYFACVRHHHIINRCSGAWTPTNTASASYWGAVLKQLNILGQTRLTRPKSSLMPSFSEQYGQLSVPQDWFWRIFLVRVVSLKTLIKALPHQINPILYEK